MLWRCCLFFERGGSSICSSRILTTQITQYVFLPVSHHLRSKPPTYAFPHSISPDILPNTKSQLTYIKIICATWRTNIKSLWPCAHQSMARHIPKIGLQYPLPSFYCFQLSMTQIFHSETANQRLTILLREGNHLLRHTKYVSPPPAILFPREGVQR